MYFPPGYGVPVRKNDRWQAAWMLMNMKLYQERCSDRLLFESKPLYGLPSDPVYHVPPGAPT